MSLRIQNKWAPLFGLLLVFPAVATASEGGSSGHDGLDCNSCHGRADRAQDASRTRDQRCLQCHEVNRRGAGVSAVFHLDPDAACTDCHSFHRTDELKADGTVFQHEFGIEAVGNHCVTCHGRGRSTDGLSEGHRAAARIYHGNDPVLARLSPSEGCLLCHSRHDADAVALAAVVDAPPRFVEHASHPYGAAVKPGATSGGFRVRRVLDPRLPLYDGRMECQTCHDITDDADDLLVRFDAPTDLCLGCHQRQTRVESVVAAVEPPRSEGPKWSRDLGD